MTIHLTTPLPMQLQLPTRTCWGRSIPARCRARGPYLALLPVGLALPPLLPAARWALTPPFHPYPKVPAEAAVRGGLFSVALSVGLPRPGVTRHRIFLESGLSSTLLPRPRSSSLPRPPALASGPSGVNGAAALARTARPQDRQAPAAPDLAGETAGARRPAA